MDNIKSGEEMTERVRLLSEAFRLSPDVHRCMDESEKKPARRSVSMHSLLHVTLCPEPLLLAGTSEASTSSAPSGSGMLPPQCSAPCTASMIS